MTEDTNSIIKQKLTQNLNSDQNLEAKLLRLKSFNTAKKLTLNSLKIKTQLQKKLFEREIEIGRIFIEKFLGRLLHFALPTAVIVFTLFLVIQVSILPKSTNKPKEALAGVIENNQNSSKNSSSSKTETPPESIFEVPFIKQESNTGSQLASLSMVLKYYNIDKNQDQILQKIGRGKPTEIKTVNNNLVWSDPQESFTGDPNGNFGNENGIKSSTGWGILDKPLIKFAIENGKKAENLTSGTLKNLYYELNQKNPVILWLVKDEFNKEKLSIFTSSGTKEELYQVYSVVATGYKSVEGGKRVIFINDPTIGKVEIPEDELNRYWSGGENRSVVVK